MGGQGGRGGQGQGGRGGKGAEGARNRFYLRIGSWLPRSPVTPDGRTIVVAYEEIAAGLIYVYTAYEVGGK
jgi:hypothetical protein